MRALRLILLAPLVLAVLLAPVTDAAEFRVKGVLVSPSGSSALINNTVLREGEQVDGVEILAISETEVRIRRGSQQLTVPVGTRATWDLATRYTPAAPVERVAQSNSAERYGPVQRGETLSEIAERHLIGDVTRHQMMVALFDANPKAFDGNINLLREGAVLEIPKEELLYQQAPATAVAEVLRQTDAWRGGHEQQLEPVEVAAEEVYGPVTRGETLSGIAASLSRDGTSMNQMMIALFETNPQAFNGNINVLRQGAVLQIPDNAALLRHSHETATAAVVDHMGAWRHRSVQQLQSRIADDSVQVNDAVLLSMQGL